MLVAAPVVTIVVIMAVADHPLIGVAFVTCIPRPYISMVFPWITLVNYGFVTVVPVVVSVPWW